MADDVTMEGDVGAIGERMDDVEDDEEIEWWQEDDTLDPYHIEEFSEDPVFDEDEVSAGFTEWIPTERDIHKAKWEELQLMKTFNV